MIIMAHRGSSDQAPENTLAAFELALKVGSNGIELDVHLTKDGEVVVIHDHTLDRTTNGKGLVENHTLAELKELDAGSWFSPEFVGQRLPSLIEVLKLVKDHDVLLNIETKVALGFEALNEKLVPLLDEYEMWDRTIVSSFNHYALAQLKIMKPQVRTGILYNCGMVNPWVYAKSIGASALHPHYMTIIPEIVRGAQENGMMVNVWTVDEKVDIQRVLQLDVDGIISNLPGVVKSLM